MDNEKKDVKVLKRMSGNQVTYDVDYLLANLAREVYLLESYRRWRDSPDRKLEQFLSGESSEEALKRDLPELFLNRGEKGDE